tara:strand:- start:4569 stop:4682 length:114 start_codon:yes stop_codon:yes gene_type:complete
MRRVLVAKRGREIESMISAHDAAYMCSVEHIERVGQR